MLAAARSLAHPLRAATFEALIGLMAATGIRTGEATGLDRADADLAGKILVIRGTKFGKSRLVPLHATQWSISWPTNIDATGCVHDRPRQRSSCPVPAPA
jgi:integrase